MNINETTKREIGYKLANFRKKLGLLIGEKKITQTEFGAMFGGFSLREISTYEIGEVDAPGTLLFAIWKAGFSIDDLFAEAAIPPELAAAARELYRKAQELKALAPELINAAHVTTRNKGATTATTGFVAETDIEYPKRGARDVKPRSHKGGKK